MNGNEFKLKKKSEWKVLGAVSDDIFRGLL